MLLHMPRDPNGALKDDPAATTDHGTPPSVLHSDVAMEWHELPSNKHTLSPGTQTELRARGDPEHPANVNPPTPSSSPRFGIIVCNTLPRSRMAIS